MEKVVVRTKRADLGNTQPGARQLGKPPNNIYRITHTFRHSAWSLVNNEYLPRKQVSRQVPPIP